MIPRTNMGAIPRIGVEIEVSTWGSSSEIKRAAICKELMNQGLMYAPTDEDMDDYGIQPFDEGYHTYGCSCFVCKQWETNDVDPYPVQFTLEYDGSLPTSGGEFITSPFPILEEFYESFLSGWHTITKNAIRNTSLTAKNGGRASPSLHVHASCFNPNNYNPSNAIELIKLIAPEVYVLGMVTGLDRGPKYRHIDYASGPVNKDYLHHRVINITHMQLNGKNLDIASILAQYPDIKQESSTGRVTSGPHIEVRTWEAEYKEPMYLDAAVHFTAGLAQVLSSNAICAKILGYNMISRTAHANRSTKGFDTSEKIVEVVDPALLEIVFSAILRTTYVNNWINASNAIEWLYEKVFEEVLS